MTAPGGDRLRLDKWLWHARMAKSRTLAAKIVLAGHVRVNGQRVENPARPVKVGDVLTLALAHATLVVEVRALGTRRGPASEARELYALPGGTAPSATPVSGRDDAPLAPDDKSG
ncbi:RNA-binding S4 domain-containing protein [Chelatococcus sp. SYSU_G07232]|uniref:RNA-binding S4 domain-containing protein n=1 Tax=Chelatococcus albus TaxID=3047466 RepID=A0ABT7AE76_9HYPH|nr:RNA-binding S4 domain-containing protein [Chelatococcus sp. SYSU_G07232]MDJ1157405.1 RNA-binding S4 domain-containing protein [Chelatococcus sp. SYSU_G07232]